MRQLHVSLDDAQLSPAAQKLQEPLEAQLSSALQRAAEHLQHDYHGESVAEVSARLLEIARSSLHPDIAAAFAPDPAELRQAADAVITATDQATDQATGQASEQATEQAVQQP